MSREQNITLVRVFLEKAWNQKDVSVVDRLIAHNHVTYGPYTGGLPPGRDGQRTFLSSFIMALPDLKMTVDRIDESRNVVRAYLSCHGTHMGDLMGIPASGKPVTFKVYFAGRIVSGQIVESCAEWDPNVFVRRAEAAFTG